MVKTRPVPDYADQALKRGFVAQGQMIADLINVAWTPVAWTPVLTIESAPTFSGVFDQYRTFGTLKANADRAGDRVFFDLYMRTEVLVGRANVDIKVNLPPLDADLTPSAVTVGIVTGQLQAFATIADAKTILVYPEPAVTRGFTLASGLFVLNLSGSYRTVR